MSGENGRLAGINAVASSATNSLMYFPLSTSLSCLLIAAFPELNPSKKINVTQTFTLDFVF